MNKEVNLADIKRSFKPLSGKGFCLRLLTDGDLPITLAWRNREDIRYQFIHSGIIIWEDHLSWWKKYQSRSDDFVFIIEDTGDLKKPVGQVSLYNINLEKGEAEYGRLMIGEKKARGKGLALGSTMLILSWGFVTLGLKKIYLAVFKSNAPAIVLYRSCGFVITEERDQLYLMCILNQDYASRNKPGFPKG